MAKQRTTFGKLQRDRDKQARNAAKQERRVANKENPPEEAPVVAPSAPVDEAKVLAALAGLQADFGSGRISQEEFEETRTELARKLGMG
jgi:hypothetical protein